MARLPAGTAMFKGDVYCFSTLPASMKVRAGRSDQLACRVCVKQLCWQDSDVLFIATGVRPSLFYPAGPFEVDYQGTLNLLAAAQQAGVKHIVLISSIGADDLAFPLNLAFGAYPVSELILLGRIKLTVKLFVASCRCLVLQEEGRCASVHRAGWQRCSALALTAP